MILSAPQGQLLTHDAGQGAESALLISSLKDVIRNQAAEIDKLQSQIKSLSAPNDEVSLRQRPFGLQHLFDDCDRSRFSACK